MVYLSRKKLKKSLATAKASYEYALSEKVALIGALEAAAERLGVTKNYGNGYKFDVYLFCDDLLKDAQRRRTQVNEQAIAARLYKKDDSK